VSCFASRVRQVRGAECVPILECVVIRQLYGILGPAQNVRVCSLQRQSFNPADVARFVRQNGLHKNVSCAPRPSPVLSRTGQSPHYWGWTCSRPRPARRTPYTTDMCTWMTARDVDDCARRSAHQQAGVKHACRIEGCRLHAHGVAGRLQGEAGVPACYDGVRRRRVRSVSRCRLAEQAARFWASPAMAPRRSVGEEIPGSCSMRR